MNYREFIADKTRDCAVVAHRGIWRDAPENSLSAIERAIDAGYDIVEIDIRRSVDGELFLLHDETLERMTGLDQRPEALSSRDLAVLRLRDRDGGGRDAFTLEKLPCLADVFDLTRDRIFLHLDVKQRDVIPDAIALASTMGVSGQVDFWAALTSERDLSWIREMIPHDVLFMAKTRLNVPDAATQLALLGELMPDVCEIYFDDLQQLSALNDIRRRNGMALWVNTLDSVACAGFTDTAALADPDAVWGRLIDAGISVIQTDEAAALKSYLAARRALTDPRKAEMTHYVDYIADSKRAPAIVAHRGAWHGAPENSLAAIERAIAVGANVVELDIRKSADGELFIMHDDTLLRVAGIGRDAETFTMAELQAIALREDDGGEHRATTDQRIPTLKQALEIIRGRIFADLDLKDRALFSEVAACAREMNAASYVDLKTRVMSREELNWVRAQNIDGVAFMAMSKFTAEGIDETMALLSEIKPFMCEMRFDRLETIVEHRETFHNAGMALWMNTLNMAASGEWVDKTALVDPDRIWGRLIDAGVSVFQTDEPEALKAYLEGRSA